MFPEELEDAVSHFSVFWGKKISMKNLSDHHVFTYICPKRPFSLSTALSLGIDLPPESTAQYVDTDLLYMQLNGSLVGH